MLEIVLRHSLPTKILDVCRIGRYLDRGPLAGQDRVTPEPDFREAAAPERFFEYVFADLLSALHPRRLHPAKRIVSRTAAAMQVERSNGVAGRLLGAQLSKDARDAIGVLHRVIENEKESRRELHSEALRQQRLYVAAGVLDGA